MTPLSLTVRIPDQPETEYRKELAAFAEMEVKLRKKGLWRWIWAWHLARGSFGVPRNTIARSNSKDTV